MPLRAASLDRPHRVLAGPGTGKTRTLVELYAELVESGRARRGEILVLTFSTSAAGEIARRLDERLRDSYDQAWISTFHSFCARLLRDHVPSDRLLLSGFQEWLVMRRALQGLGAQELGPFAPLRRHDSFVQDVLAFVALLKQNLYYPNAFAMLAQTSGTDRLRALAAAFSAYQAELDRARLADFRDLVAGVVTLLERDDELRRRLRERFRYVLVDEFQDVDPAQFFLLRQLAPPGGASRLVVLGDPDQSIYGFRGTVPRLLTEEFARHYPGFGEALLDRSHRCPEPVLEAAERLLAATQGADRRPRRLLGTEAARPAVTVAREDNPVDEAFFVAREIRRLVIEEGRRPGECAVLLRSTTALAAPFEEAIRALDLPYEVRGLAALGRNEVVRFVLAYLRALADRDEAEGLERVLASGLSGVPARTVGRLRRHAIEEARPFKKVVHRVLYRIAARDPERWPLPWPGQGAGGGPGEGVSDPDFLPLITEPELDALHAALSAFHRLRAEAGRLPVSALGYAVLLETGVLGRLATLPIDPAVRDEALADLRATLDGLRELEEVEERLTGAKPTLAALAGQRLESLIARAVDEAEPAAARTRDAVQVMTIHQAKGLEFPFVFLSGFAHGLFPLPLRRHPLLDERELGWLETELTGFRPAWPRDQQEQAAEEARLAYVGLTRARERLWITYADEYDEPAGPSAFLELAAPEAREVDHSRSSGLVDPASVLTLTEAETALALAGPLDAATAERASALGADLDFVTSPAAGQPFRPFAVAATGVDPDHFSATAINDYLKCPRIYWYSQHPGLAAPPRSVEMARGSFLHEVLEEFHNRESEWRDLPPDAQREWLLAELERRLEHYLGTVEGTLERRAEEQEVRRILDNYVRFATSSQPIRRLGTLATEKRFALDLDGDGDGGRPARVVGKIDRINDTGDGTCEVVDYKTGRGGPAPRKYGEYFGPDLHDVQLALYYLACRQGVGEDGEPIALQPRWLSLWYPKEWVYGQMRQVLFAVGDPAPGVREWVQRALEPEDLERSREVVVEAIRSIRQGRFAPAPKDVVGTCRSYFGCPHAPICPYGGQPVDP